MNKILSLILLFITTAACCQTFSDDDIRQALYGAVDQVSSSLKSAPFNGKTVAVLPFPGDKSNLIAGRLKNIVTGSGFTCIEGKEDPMWNEILKEIAWDERKSDILDPSTMVKFGKLKAAQILLYGKIRTIDKNADRVYAEIELHATDIASKQHVWGGNFAFRFYKGKDAFGIIALDNDLRMLLKKNFAAAKQSLQEPASAAKLSKISTVTVIPLAGDVDQYITGLAIETLSQTRHLPKNPQIPSLSHMRAFIRDGKAGSDAILYGMVRDLRRGKPVSLAAGKSVKTTVTVYADIQLFLEEAKSGVILWSKTITMSEEIVKIRPMTKEELSRASQEKIDAVPENIKEDVIDNWKKYLLIAGGIIGGIVLLLVILFAVKAFFSYNNVR